MGLLAVVVPGLRQLLHAPIGAEWVSRSVSRNVLDELHTLMSLGPAMLDASPTRALFLNSDGAKGRLMPLVAAGHRADVAGAPVCAIVGYDTVFAEQLCEFLPGAATTCHPVQTAHDAALRNGALQGAYLTVAARSLGLEAAPLPDFDAEAVAAEFFRNQRMRVTFVGALGYPASPAT
jgi:3-hydroxypropanoate dehydrogenase